MQRTAHEDSWLKASDFNAEGKTLTIDRVELKEIAPDTEKLVVFFTDERKGLVLNEVNYKVIAKNTGEDDSANWNGFKITPYSTSILVKGEPMACIRIKILVNTFAERVN